MALRAGGAVCWWCPARLPASPTSRRPTPSSCALGAARTTPPTATRTAPSPSTCKHAGAMLGPVQFVRSLKRNLTSALGHVPWSMSCRHCLPHSSARLRLSDALLTAETPLSCSSCSTSIDRTQTVAQCSATIPNAQQRVTAVNFYASYSAFPSPNPGKAARSMLRAPWTVLHTALLIQAVIVLLSACKRCGAHHVSHTHCLAFVPLDLRVRSESTAKPRALLPMHAGSWAPAPTVFPGQLPFVGPRTFHARTPVQGTPWGQGPWHVWIAFHVEAKRC